MPEMFRYLSIALLVIPVLVSCSTSAGPSDEREQFDFTACVNGFSREFPCKNIDLYYHLSPNELLGEKLNDIWGWKDPETGKEYALAGLTDGVSIIDITKPDEPVVIGKLIEPVVSKNEFSEGLTFRHDDGGGFKEASDWRDIKVYNNHMFVVSEQANHGLQIFDLTQVRNIDNPPVLFTDFSLYSEFGNAHNIAINEETGFAYVVGSTSGITCANNGALHIIDISVPDNPQFAGCHFEEKTGGRTKTGYIHDTQCVIYNGPDTRFNGKEICFNSGETTLMISDVTSKAQPVTVSNSSYEGIGYLHQGWLSENHAYFFTNDEDDERQFHHPTRTYVWHIEDLENPSMIGFYEQPTLSVDHNLYIRHTTMYQANYTAGLRVLDIEDPHPNQIREIGFFDTTPQNDKPVFAGLWSVYPWLDGDKVIVSDINNGLFILKVNSKK